MKRRLLATLLSLTLMLSLVPSAWAVENEESSQEAVVEEPETELIEGLQVRINALPDADTLAEMDEDEQAKVYAEVCDIYDTIDKLTPEEGKALDVSALEEAAAFFTQQIMPLDSEPAGEMFGNCGAPGSESSVTWKLEQNNKDSENPTYTLTISGKGAMADYTTPNPNPTKPDAEGANIAPWYSALTADRETGAVPITQIVVGDQITGLGDNAFAYTSVEKAEFKANVTDYGDALYYYCPNLTTVNWDNFCPEDISDGWVTERKQTGPYVPFSLFDGCKNLTTCIIGEQPMIRAHWCSREIFLQYVQRLSVAQDLVPLIFLMD